MSSRSIFDQFLINTRWPAQQPELLQLYSFPTPNGVKISIALEELGIAYEPHFVTLSETDVKSDAYSSLNPNNKIPAIIDPNGPGNSPIALFESGVILQYLAEKSGKLMGRTAHDKYKVLQWLTFQLAGVGPMFGQLGYFHAYAGKTIDDPRPKQRYVDEAKRLLAVINKQLEGHDWITGDDYTIADIALAPWIQTLERFYQAEELTGLLELPRVLDYIDRFAERPAVIKGWQVPAK